MTQPILGRGYEFLCIPLLYERQPFFSRDFKLHLQRFSTVKEIYEILLRKKLRFVQRKYLRFSQVVLWSILVRR